MSGGPKYDNSSTGVALVRRGNTRTSFISLSTLLPQSVSVGERVGSGQHPLTPTELTVQGRKGWPVSCRLEPRYRTRPVLGIYQAHASELRNYLHTLRAFGGVLGG